MCEMPARKTMRLKGYDYSQAGCYFVTICTAGRRPILGRIVGSDDLGAPALELSGCGKNVEKHTNEIERHYDISMEKYVLMPNHVHLLFRIKNGVPGSSRPTMLVPRMVAAWKKMTNEEAGFTPLTGGAYEGFRHWVEQAVDRDIAVAFRDGSHSSGKVESREFTGI